jgi:methyl acetate hydrolase
MSAATIDGVLRRAVEAGEVPGVVAMAATDRGTVYEGAFGRRVLPDGPAMTLDTVFRIASMTKAITSVAALQLVEAGKLTLDGPVPDIDPTLARPQVLDGFDGGGAPILRPARRPITLRHLLTHTAGFGYEVWDEKLKRYVAATGVPAMSSGQLAALRQPLMFDPGERWEYGINIDWVGRLVEEAGGKKLDAYFRDHITGPLGMDDTAFSPSPAMRARQAAIHQRGSDGSLAPQPLEPLPAPEFWAGGGALYSTAGDYLKFLAMLRAGGGDILRPETVALLGENHIGGLQAGVMKTTTTERSGDVDFFPGARVRWGLATLINAETGPCGRSPGSLSWAGLFNTYYWLDPARRLGAAIMTQILPFADTKAVALYGAFERQVYATLDG